MPITERTARACFTRLRNHIAPVVAATLGAHYQLLLYYPQPSREVAALCFREGGVPTGIPIDTEAHGPLYFRVYLVVRCLQERRAYRLTTHQYGYYLSRGPRLDDAALLRWEYDPEQTSGWWPHVQAAARLRCGEGNEMDLNRVHVPSGRVTLESVIRFLIADLGVRPAREDWDERLNRSERTFAEEFASRRHFPYG